MNIVFIGASKFGLRCLEVCMAIPNLNVVGVVTAKETFSISYRPAGVTNVLHADIASMAVENGIPVAVLEDSMHDSSLFELVATWRPDAFVVAGWYHMIPKHWRAMAPAYGLHASLLPDYSGGAPLVWAIINGENKTGITLFQMSDGVDAGPIVAQVDEPIHVDDNIATLYARIEERGLELLRYALPAMATGALVPHAQDENKRRIFPQRGPEDGLINWDQDAAVVDRFIRAQTRPYPGAFSKLNGSKFTIWVAKVEPLYRSCDIGLIAKTGNAEYTVSCRNGGIVLQDINYEMNAYMGPQLSELLGEGGQLLG